MLNPRCFSTFTAGTRQGLARQRSSSEWTETPPRVPSSAARLREAPESTSSHRRNSKTRFARHAFASSSENGKQKLGMSAPRCSHIVRLHATDRRSIRLRPWRMCYKPSMKTLALILGLWHGTTELELRQDGSYVRGSARLTDLTGPQSGRYELQDSRLVFHADLPAQTHICLFSLQGKILTLSDCEYSGTYRR